MYLLQYKYTQFFEIDFYWQKNLQDSVIIIFNGCSLCFQKVHKRRSILRFAHIFGQIFYFQIFASFLLVNLSFTMPIKLYSNKKSR